MIAGNIQRQPFYSKYTKRIFELPGTDFIEVRTPYDIPRTLEELEVTPEAFYEIRVSGRMQAERFRASRVYPRVVADLMADVEAFGGRRRSA